jgi:hypothetical protein
MHTQTYSHAYMHTAYQTPLSWILARPQIFPLSAPLSVCQCFACLPAWLPACLPACLLPACLRGLSCVLSALAGSSAASQLVPLSSPHHIVPPGLRVIYYTCASYVLSWIHMIYNSTTPHHREIVSPSQKAEAGHADMMIRYDACCRCRPNVQMSECPNASANARLNVYFPMQFDAFAVDA